MIETMSLSLSLISLTVAVLCMMNVKYVSYLYVKLFRLQPANAQRAIYPPPRPLKPHFYTVPTHLPLICRCLLTFRRLHLPRNLLHMHLFLAFILRSIVKLVFIHTIVGGYTRSMITYSLDKCGNIEIISKSSNLFHVSHPPIVVLVAHPCALPGHRLSDSVLAVLVHRCGLSDVHLLRGDVPVHRIDEPSVP